MSLLIVGEMLANRRSKSGTPLISKVDLVSIKTCHSFDIKQY